MKVTFKPEVGKDIEKLCTDTGLTLTGVFNEALSLYQEAVRRAKAGEYLPFTSPGLDHAEQHASLGGKAQAEIAQL